MSTFAQFVEIGGGTNPRHGFRNLDPVHGEGRFKRRVQDGIPLPNNTCREVFASHVLEHVPAGGQRVKVFNEVWRTLIPGGKFTIVVPVLVSQDGRVWPHAIADPTHVSFFVARSFDYFCQPIAHADYDIRWWRKESYREHEFEAMCVLRKPPT